MKKALIFFIILTALILTLTLTVSAEDVIRSGTWGDLTWELNETTGELVISGVGEMDDLTNDDAWRPFCGKIKSVKVSSGITSIGANAFMGCNMVTSVVLPDSLLKIGSNAFYQCIQITELYIPDTVYEIGAYGFYHCFGLTSIDLPYNLVTIGEYAFDSCYRVTGTIVIPQGVTVLPEGVFKGCNHVETVVLPDGLITIGDSVFSTCEMLKNVNFPDTLKEIGVYAFSSTDIESVVINAELNSIGDNAFAACRMSNLILPRTIESIGNAVFKGCRNLQDVVIPEGVKSIGNEAFLDCYSLESITLPSTLEAIGDSAFSGCRMLNNLNIQKNVSSIGKSCFYGCEALINLVIEAGNTSYKATDGILYSYDGKSIIFYPISRENTEFVIPDGVETISEFCFRNSYLTDITIPSSVKYIGRVAFGCENLKNVHIEDLDAWCGIEYLDPNQNVSSPLHYADNLYLDGELVTSVTFRKELGKVPDLVFYNYKKLKEVIIEEGIETIGAYAFEESGVTRITLPEGLTTIGERAFVNCPIKIIVIPSTVTNIGWYSFYGCSVLNAVVYKPDGEPVKNSYLLNYGAILVEGEEDIIDLDGYIFVRSPEDKYLLVDYKGEDRDLVLPSYVNEHTYEICQGAFLFVDGITSMVIPEGVTKIHGKFITDFSKLTHITYNAIRCVLSDEALRYTPIIESKGYTLKIGKSVTVIPNYVFSGSAVTIVEIEEGSSLTKIEDNAFSGCIKLVEVINRSSLEIKAGSNDHGKIGSYAIEVHKGSSKLEKVGDFVFFNGENTKYLVNYLYAGMGGRIMLPDDFYGSGYEVWKSAFLSPYSNQAYSMIVIPEKVTKIHNNVFPQSQRDHVVYISSPDVAAELTSWTSGGYLIYLVDTIAIDSSIGTATDYIKDEYIIYAEGGIELFGKTYDVYTRHYCTWEEHNIEMVECERNGFEGVKCSFCGAYSGNVMLAHDYADATCATPKTCKRDGCEATYGTPDGHSFTDFVSNGDATCSANGTETAKCDTCDKIHVREALNTKLAHTYTNYVSDGNATCVADGTKTAKCDDCDETDTMTDTDSKLGHDFADATCVLPKTCKRDGCTATDGSALGHSFTNYVSNNDATCVADGTKTARCDRCDETDTITDTDSKLGHDFADATCELPKTCKRDGCMATDGSALGHEYDNACDGVCNICEATRTPSSHVWDEGAVTKEPTKKEEGVKTYACTVCGETKTEPVPKLTGCGGGGGAMIALLSNSAILLVWFALKKKH